MIKPSPSDLIKSSVRSIAKNKGRTLLTSLGIIIGVTSVILLTSIGNGLKKYVSDQFESLGSNVVYIVPGKVFNDEGGFSNTESFVTLTFDDKDISKISRQFKNDLVIPSTQLAVDVKAGDKIKKGRSLIGTTPEYGPANNSVPKETNGRWFTQEETDKNSKVAVLGNKIAQDLFGSVNPLGKKIIVKGKNLKVIGVVDKKGSTFGGPSLDDHIYTTIGTVQNITGNSDINTIQVKIKDKSLINKTKTDLEKLLLDRYEKDTFSVFDSSQLLSSINSIIGTLTIALTGIAAISLVVGGIGIMNIMLVTVSERTKEIGLRKAIGAYPRAILVQFLIEAIILSALGGFIGVVLGALGTLAINQFFPAQITPGSIILAFGVSSLVGVIFGVAPARKASKLSPIEALRYE
ncbi:MAG TPA: ABC transporter permease [Candidatus Woesebacteria bacterium]|nr:ABC transporter permease [Candidatus Woesebacteria bacterium]HPJ17166.1 ABC transporter permease [Candidatus Woesebacteria bacterium]